MRLSTRLTVKPNWQSYVAQSGEQLIELDSGMSFGTGAHPTTMLAVRMLEQVVQGGED